ncbi:PREDICTED: auxin-responsive protein SAUR15-like [Camelina sativa]|uniref:Auxin-responsive protein SAUR15-like n=1 Tax=Camelina sativa TaxID=90675 RepID=A0ABM1QMH9_CAMSA|nr:PREDICTED: auxin-responsive protein SAUR15-like [Camelina sativa]
MTFLRSFLGAKQIMRRRESSSSASSTPRGFMAVYVGENDQKRKRYVVPVSYLNQPLFQELLSKSEEEFGFDHPTGGLTIPCHESLFFTVTSQIR